MDANDGAQEHCIFRPARRRTADPSPTSHQSATASASAPAPAPAAAVITAVSFFTLVVVELE